MRNTQHSKLNEDDYEPLDSPYYPLFSNDNQNANMENEAQIKLHRLAGVTSQELKLQPTQSLTTAVKLGLVSVIFPLMTMGFLHMNDRLLALNQINSQNGAKLKQLEMRIDNMKHIQDQRFKKEHQYRKNNDFYKDKQIDLPDHLRE